MVNILLHTIDVNAEKDSLFTYHLRQSHQMRMKTCSHKIMWKNFKNVKNFKNIMQTFFCHECFHCVVNLFAKSVVNLLKDPTKPLPDNN
jgi:hypothetical protein